MRNFLIFICITTFGMCGTVHAENADPRSDQWIQGRLEGALDFNSYFASSDVDVRVDRGAVTLSGEVPSAMERQFAEKVAGRIEGVKSVKNNIEINDALVSENRSEISEFIADAALVAKVQTKLDASRTIEGSEIEVEANKGVVYLSGRARSDRAKDQAGHLAESTYGVRDVKNKIIISNAETVGDKVENTIVDVSRAVSDVWITTKVRSMILFHSDFIGSDISVETKEGVVRLSGQVENEDLKETLTAEAEDIRGVKKVLNQTRILSAAG